MLWLPSLLLACYATLAQANTATVILLRGNASTQSGKALALKDTITPGTIIKTAPKSFVKLLFGDQTSMNIGPDTTLKIEPTRAGEASLVNLAAGQLRAKVNKDPSKNQEDKEKLVIKTKTAAMGIRGTDFNVTFNNQNNITALVTFEGQVAMTKLVPGQDPVQALAANDQVQNVGAGQYSGAQPDLAQASVPVKISPSQLESLKANDSFQGLGDRVTDKAASVGSPVPPGVDPKTFSSSGLASLQSQLGALAPEAKPTPTQDGPPPEGFFNAKTGSYAPRAGGFIDLSTGRYLPPPPGSSFDPNTGVFVPPKAMGEINPNTGLYVPPKGVELDAVKGFVPDKSAGAPSAGAQNLASVLNFAASPQLAGVTNTAVPLFGPGATGILNNLLPALPPPGLLSPPPPLNPNDTDCLECRYQNQTPVLPTSSVRFQINVI